MRRSFVCALKIGTAEQHHALWEMTYHGNDEGVGFQLVQPLDFVSIITRQAQSRGRWSPVWVG